MRTAVMEAMDLASQRVPAVVRRLQRRYQLTNGELGEALGVSDTVFSARARGISKFSPAELAGLAELFALPVGVFYMTPAEAERLSVERDPELTACGGWAARDSNSEPAGSKPMAA